MLGKFKSEGGEVLVEEGVKEQSLVNWANSSKHVDFVGTTHSTDLGDILLSYEHDHTAAGRGHNRLLCRLPPLLPPPMRGIQFNVKFS